VACAACGGRPSSAPAQTAASAAFLPSPSPTAATASASSRSAEPTAAADLSPTSSPTSTRFPTSTSTPELFAERIPILEYHYTTFRFNDDIQMTTDWFRSQMRTLAEGGYSTITAEQLAAFLDGKNIPAKSVVLTFDVGTAQRADFADNIIPALREFGFHAFFFVLTQNINDACGEGNKICWQELRDWADQGLISVESHGVYHPDYATISAEEQRWDLSTSLRIIAEKTGRAPVGFAYPYDSYNDAALRVVKSVGYAFALAGNTRNDRSVHIGDPDRYHLPRVYPYSNPRIYPVIYGTSGLTFDQLVFQYSAAQPAA
jgi:peptidoglycan/xylan/chitin deacetylase (PgdA/CDA1 family)